MSRKKQVYEKITALYCRCLLYTSLVEELRAQVAIAQCEENESHFKYGFSAGLLVQQEAHEQVSQREKE